MQVYKNPVKRHFKWGSALYLTVFCYTRSLTPIEPLPSVPTHHFSGTVLAFYYTDNYSCHYTRMCIYLKMSKVQLHLWSHTYNAPKVVNEEPLYIEPQLVSNKHETCKYSSDCTVICVNIPKKLL